MTNGIRAGCVACMMATAAGRDVRAQGVEDPARGARIRLGPLAVDPVLSITNVGLDANVFNEAVNPKSDFTGTVSPSLQLWMRLGRARIAGSTQLDVIFFKQYSNEGTVGTTNIGRVDFVLNRVRPFVSGSFRRLQDRLSPEIDTRLEHVEDALTAGVLVRLATRTAFTLSHEQTGLSFEDQTVLGTHVRNELSRSQESRVAGLQYDLTPLTKLVTDVRDEYIRFDFSPDRDGHALRLVPGLLFKPTALISGELRVGVLRYEPNDRRLPTFSGPIAAVDVRSVIRGDNEVVVAVDRDLSYALESQVYYLQSRAAVTVTHSLSDRWSLTGRTSRLWLSYSARPLNSGSPPRFDAAITAARPDTVSSIGFGIGWRVRPGVRSGFGIDYYKRDSTLPSGRYTNLRALASVTYGGR